MGNKRVKNGKKKKVSDVLEDERKVYKRYLIKVFNANLVSTLNSIDRNVIEDEKILNEKICFLENHMNFYNDKLNNIVSRTYISKLVGHYKEMLICNSRKFIKTSNKFNENPDDYIIDGIFNMIGVFKESNKDIHYLLTLDDFIKFNNTLKKTDRTNDLIMRGLVQMMYVSLLKGNYLEDKPINFIFLNTEDNKIFIEYKEESILKKDELKIIDNVKNRQTINSKDSIVFEKVVEKVYFISDSMYLCFSTNDYVYQIYDALWINGAENLDNSIENSMFLNTYKERETDFKFNRKYLYPREGVKLVFSNKNEILDEIIILEDLLSYFFSIKLKNGYFNNFKISKESILNNEATFYSSLLMDKKNIDEYFDIIKYSLYIAYCNPKEFKDLKIFNNVRKSGSGSSKRIHFKVAHLRKLPIGYIASESALNKARILGFECVPEGYTFVSASNEELSKMKEIVV